ncbi:hypothetical protein QOZ80_3BG0279680 [Eleusine coracana subsp. coracana]|nr:hypothetical protein QOZ80_3BG0279680 [Eleusine coracana subsp. coracana]
MLYVVCLGLGDERGVTLRGLDAVRRCARVYMELYASLLAIGTSDDPPSRLASLVRPPLLFSGLFFIARLVPVSSVRRNLAAFSVVQEELHGKEITVLHRAVAEERADQLLREAACADVAFLVVDHPFGSHERIGERAHTDLVIRAKNMGIQVEVIDSASVVNAVGVCGLQLRRYGEAVTIPFFTECCKPDRFYQAIVNNRWLGLHTLCLLDIHVKERASEDLCSSGRNEVYEQPRFMTVNTAISQLLEVLDNRGEPDPAYDADSLCIGVARLGREDQKIVAGPMGKLVDVDFGSPPHRVVIVGEMNPVEEEMLQFYMIK